MLSFLICGLCLLLYGYKLFMKTKILYPSVVFSAMWGMACLFTAFILLDWFGKLYLSEYYNFKYMDEYIIFFTIASLAAFMFAHQVYPGAQGKVEFDYDFLVAVTRKYHWIMWLNFFGGLLRIVLMINLIGFNSVMDYRLAANAMMNSGLGPVGLVFRITNYIQLLANFYVALDGFRTGFETIKLKKIVGLFILYAPTQMATGGRLFILYFILFFFGSFLLGRGLAVKTQGRKLLESAERRSIMYAMVGMLSLVPIIAMSRTDGSSRSESKRINRESAIAKFTYVCEGMLESEHYMRFYPPDKIRPDHGTHFLTGKSQSYLKYRGFLNGTYMSSIVISIISPLYTSFGYWGSIIVWGILAFLLEAMSITCLKRLTVIRFLIFLTIIKIMYESVMTNSVYCNIPTYELIILIAIFYQFIFGKKTVYS